MSDWAIAILWMGTIIVIIVITIAMTT